VISGSFTSQRKLKVVASDLLARPIAIWVFPVQVKIVGNTRSISLYLCDQVCVYIGPILYSLCFGFAGSIRTNVNVRKLMGVSAVNFSGLSKCVCGLLLYFLTAFLLFL